MKSSKRAAGRSGRASGHQDASLERMKKTLRASLPELRRRYGVRSLGLFGSYVRGERGKGSDLDVLVELDDRGITLLQFIALENELCDMLGVKVDLVERSALKPAIGRHILQEVVAV